MITKNEIIREKILRIMKQNKSVEEIYLIFVKSKTEEEIKKILNLLKSFARISNKDFDIRAKSLATLGYFKYISCSDNKEEFFKDIKVICNDLEIPVIIEENIDELIEFFEKSAVDLLKEDKLNHLLVQTIIIIDEFKIKNIKVRRLITAIKKSLDLEEKNNKKSLNQRENYIFEQIKRMKLT